MFLEGATDLKEEERAAVRLGWGGRPQAERTEMLKTK